MAASSSASAVREASQKLFTVESLRAAAKQTPGILVIPLRLRRAIKRYIRERGTPNMRRNVLRLSESFNGMKVAAAAAASGSNKLLTASSSSTASAELLVKDPSGVPALRSRRWKISSSYGDSGLEYGDDVTAAYIAARMPAVFSACHRVLREVRRRIPDFSPARVLDFGAGPGTATWAVRQVWPGSVEQINQVEPSQEMQRAGQSLLQGLKSLPDILSFGDLQSMRTNLVRHDHRRPDRTSSHRAHDLVIASYALGEIPSASDRITVVRQLWELTNDILVLIEPGTPQGYNIISQARSHILWMAKRKCRKIKPDGRSEQDYEEDKQHHSAFVVAPCPHDGRCPLEGTPKYCHFVQRLQRTSVQRAYKQGRGGGAPRGYEDEKFCFVVLRRGKRPLQQHWPLDGVRLGGPLEEHKEEASFDSEEQAILPPAMDDEETVGVEEAPSPLVKCSDKSLARYASDLSDADMDDELVEHTNEESQLVPSADLGGGWGRIARMPMRRGKLVEFDVCRCTKRDCSEGTFERVVLTKRSNPALHLQAKKSMWGDLWPCGEKSS